MEEFLDWEIYRADKGTPTVLAKITWNAHDDKRKAKMIRGFEFSLPVDFKGYDNKGITWSVVLKVLEPAKEDSHEVLMQIKFLFET